MTRILRRAAIVLIAAITSIGAASASTEQAKQGVEVTLRPGSAVNAFTLRPLTPGAIARDSGTVEWIGSERSRNIDGRRSRFWSGVGMFSGERGSLRVRVGIDWFDAGNGGYEAGLGTWRIVRGTGAYAKVVGNGSSAHVWLPRGPVSGRYEGFMQLR